MIYDLFNFDVRTLIGILFWGNLTSALLIYSYQINNKNSYDSKNIKLLFLSRFLKAVYYLLIFYRGTLPDIISVNLGNSLIFICHYMEGYLMLALSKVGSKKTYNLLTSILILSIILFNFIDMFFGNPGLRVALASLFMFAILVIPACVIIFTKQNSRFMKTVGLLYVFLFVCILSRAIYSFAVHELYIFTNNVIQSFTYVSFVLIMIFGTPAFLLIMKENSDQIIKKMATTDGLTNIENRQSFMDRAQTCFEGHKTSESEMALLFFDIDFFKEVNDNYGHSFGDEVLIKFADVIKRNMRSGDISCRYGGEEFLALLPRSDKKHSLLVGERIMKEISELHFEIYPEFNFTISIGVQADIPSGEDTLLSFINKADMALYEAKNTGRNKMVVYINCKS